MRFKEHLAYLHGLLEGQTFTEERDRNLWEQTLELFGLIDLELDDLIEAQSEMEEYLEAVDEDLGYLEEHSYPKEPIKGEETRIPREEYHRAVSPQT